MNITQRTISEMRTAASDEYIRGFLNGADSALNSLGQGVSVSAIYLSNRKLSAELERQIATELIMRTILEGVR